MAAGSAPAGDPKADGTAQEKPAAVSQASKKDYSKEAFVIERFSRSIAFAADGTSKREQAAVIKMQSDAGIRQFGVLAFPYNSDNEKIEIAFVRVKKTDGTVVDTPISTIQDVSSDVTRIAPMYTDLRQKQVPVKALGTGDVLEYLVRVTQTRPEAPGHFWYAQDFLSGGVVLEETLRVEVPSEKYVKVSSPKIRPVITEDRGLKIYSWKTAQLEPTPTDPKKTPVESPEPPSVQVTSFRTWDEVGHWYRDLESSRIAVTPAIQAKASELTQGLSDTASKEVAIYNYVSMQFRYISLSLGQGRYQPHAADEVLSNQYGDCKDKHTLFAALLKAAGIEAWPALLATTGKLNPELPSPAQFDHVITVLPGQPDYVWLDTTPEVAPFGFLQRGVRDRQALVIPSNGPAALQKTPMDLPAASLEKFDVKGSLSAEGVLKAHVDVTMRGDSELILRTVFHSLPPAQWQSFVQGMSYGMGFAGTISGVSADNVQDLSKPLHYSYEYVREHYSDWDNGRITPPAPPFTFTRNENSEKPLEPIDMNSPGETILRSTVQLPSGYSLAPPANANTETDFASYDAHYSLKDGVLSAERRLTTKRSKVPVVAWDDYLKFEKAVQADERQLIQLSSPNIKPKNEAATNNAGSDELVRQVYDLLKKNDINAARDVLSQAERADPKQKNLWALYGYLFMITNEPEKGLEAVRKEIEYHPDELMAYRGLAEMQLRLHRKAEAIETLKTCARKWPGETEIVSRLASLLISEKRYAEALEPVQAALAANPNAFELQMAAAEILLRSGRKAEGVEAARKLAGHSNRALGLNDAAYVLADTGTEIALAREYAEKAVALTEDAMKDASLSKLSNANLQKVNELAAFWDTLGWVYFQMGEFDKAEKYVHSSWTIGQAAAVADHLGQIYQQQGKREAAEHAFQLALAATKDYPDAREHLRLLGTEPRRSASKRKTSVPAKISISAGEELGKLRTVAVPALRKQEGSAEFFVLFSGKGVEDAQFISGAESLKNAGTALASTDFHVEFPDGGPEKIARRGILSCSQYTTPSCQLVLLLPSTTKK
jgi:tetratricopeptide (TPR) repeat protein/transglutaminase-like putative cysteine protease